MQARHGSLVLAVAALVAACGGSPRQAPDGSGSGGPTQLTLEIQTSGGGTVRGAGADCRGDCKPNFDGGTAVHLTAVADPGNVFSGWSGACTGAALCDLTLTTNQTVIANFGPQGGPSTRRLTVSVEGPGRVTSTPAGLDCSSGTCTLDLAAGKSIALSASTTGGATFAGWSGACTAAQDCSVTLDGDRQVTARFNAPPPPPPTTHRLTVSLDGQGRVTSSPGGLDCTGGTCTADFAVGASLALTAAAATGWTFAGWSGACSGASGCTLKLDNDVQVSARFNAPPPPPASAHVILAVDGPGQVTGAGLSCGSGANTCDVTVPAGSAQMINASAGSQARFIGWGGPCSGAAGTCSFTANGEVRITATFSYLLTTLIANDGTNFSQALAINSGDVFFGRYTSADGHSVWAVPKAGGQPRRVASGVSIYLVADEGYVYWTDLRSIDSAPVAGGAASQIFSGAQGVGQLVLDSDGALYFTANTDNAYQSKSQVHRMRDRVDTILVDNSQASAGVAVDDRYVYFGTLGTNATPTGELRRVPKTGGAVETVVACGNCQLSSLKADAQNVYLRSLNGEAWSVNKARPSLLLLSQANPQYFYANEIDANGSVVYWNWVTHGLNPTTNGFFSANADGSHFTALETGSDQVWYGPRVDDSALYFIHAGAVLRRLK